MQNGTENSRVADDEIDLRELFLILKKRKKIIYLITSIATIIAIVLAFFIMKPIYSVKSMIEIGSINNSSSSEMDGYAQDMVEKLSYKYKVGVKGVKRELPYINRITLPKKSKNIISLEVWARNNEEGAKYMKNVSNEIILDANKKIRKYKKKS